jgi:hypothetical protein
MVTLIVAVLGAIAAARYMVIFLWRARRAAHDMIAWAVALSAGSITVFAGLVLADLIWDLGRWVVHLAGSILFVIMFPAWTRIMDMLVAAGRRVPEDKEPGS